MSFDPAFNPDDVGIANGNYFGFPVPVDQAALVLLSAPWDVTVSYGAGAAGAPEAILAASTQVEVADYHHPEGWKAGIATLPADPWIAPASKKLRKRACRVIDHLEKGGSTADKKIAGHLAAVNDAGRHLNGLLRHQAAALLAAGKTVGLVGGDHSTPLGLMQAVAAHHREEFGILHVDAHADLRVAYEGFDYSHASIMHNALQIPGITRLVQVGIRDFSATEARRSAEDPRIVPFDDYRLARRAFEGASWEEQCREIIAHLPAAVYVSFDIDGLAPALCPGTGTPVPGGLSFHQAVYLLAQVVESGRRIIGFDLTEVSPQPGDAEWNANVGARMLYKLCNLTLKSQRA